MTVFLDSFRSMKGIYCMLVRDSGCTATTDPFGLVLDLSDNSTTLALPSWFPPIAPAAALVDSKIKHIS